MQGADSLDEITGNAVGRQDQDVAVLQPQKRLLQTGNPVADDAAAHGDVFGS